MRQNGLLNFNKEPSPNSVVPQWQPIMWPNWWTGEIHKMLIANSQFGQKQMASIGFQSNAKRAGKETRIPMF